VPNAITKIARKEERHNREQPTVSLQHAKRRARITSQVKRQKWQQRERSGGQVQ
jgi:hypothetical protein